MLHERGNISESPVREDLAGAGDQPPVPPPAGSHEERLEIARSIGYAGAAALTCGQIERGLMARLDWES